MSNNPEKSETTIADLSDNLLRQIFLRVPLTTTPGTSWVSLRAVCKRWTTILDDCWSDFHELLLITAAPHSILHDWAPHKLMAVIGTPPFKSNTAEELLKRCGPHLKKLLVNYFMSFTVSIMPLIAKTCHNLENFGIFVKTPLDAQQFAEVLEACTKLTTLKIFIKNTESRKCYSFFPKIPTHQLEDLSILTYDNTDSHLMKHIKATIRHCKVLKTLLIDCMDDELSGLLTDLRQLSIGQPVSLGMDRPSPLSLITDESLITLTQSCRKLTSIAVVECINVTDNGISALSALPALKNLTVMKLPKVTGKSLKIFTEIDTLRVFDCPTGNAEISAVIKNCPVLRSLDVSRTPITNKTLAVAVQETKKRTNNITLLIKCSLTLTNPEQFQGASPLLKISKQEVPAPFA